MAPQNYETNIFKSTQIYIYIYITQKTGKMETEEGVMEPLILG